MVQCQQGSDIPLATSAPTTDLICNRVVHVHVHMHTYIYTLRLQEQNSKRYVLLLVFHRFLVLEEWIKYNLTQCVPHIAATMGILYIYDTYYYVLTRPSRSFARSRLVCRLLEVERSCVWVWLVAPRPQVGGRRDGHPPRRMEFRDRDGRGR